MELKDWMKRCYDVAQEKGWHDKPLQIEKELMNFHAEISEAWEELRKGKGLTEVYFPGCDTCDKHKIVITDIPSEVGFSRTMNESVVLDAFAHVRQGKKPEGFPIELADLAIRLFHTCAYHGIDLEKFMELKEAYNKTRPYRHGGRVA